MTKKPIYFMEEGTPQQSIFSTLREQLEDVKTSTDERLRTATISGKKDGKLYSVTINETDLGKIGTFTEYVELSRKSDYKDEVKRLYKVDRLKQREIAQRLGISQSLVSQLLRS